MYLRVYFHQVAKLPFLINDGKWHHICVTWTTRDGVWEAFQDGVKRGSGENLAPYHPIKPQGLLILGQEQVNTLKQYLLQARLRSRRSSLNRKNKQKVVELIFFFNHDRFKLLQATHFGIILGVRESSALH